MRAPTIPNKEFLELCGTIKESDGKKQFSFNELRRQKSYSAILEYLSRTNIKYIDEGSARVAFYLPGAVDGDGRTIDAPCCLKVASSEYGVGQNKSDIKAYQRFGEDFACFPRIYSFDEKHKFYFLCELATPAFPSNGHSEIDGREYFSDFIKFASEKKYSKTMMKSLENVYDVNSFLIELFEARDTASYVYRTDITKKEAEVFKNEWLIFWNEVKKKFSKYAGMADVCIGFINNIFYDSDIDTPNNWGYVKRKNNLVLLPIDFGIGE